MRPLLIVPIVAALAAAAAPLAAQQAVQPPVTAYDQTAPVTLEGTADTVEWSAAGGKLVLQPSTGTQMWDIALPDINTMLAKGISANNLARGTPVKVRAYKATDGACNPNCKAQGIDLTLGNGGQTYDLLSPVPAAAAPPAGGQQGAQGPRGG